jgi:hypothetical protein
MLGQALAADAGSPVQRADQIAKAACNRLPKSAALDARIVPAAGMQARPTTQSSDPAPSASGTASSGTVRPSSSSSDPSSAPDSASPSPSDTSASSSSPASSPSDSPTSDPAPSSGTTSPSSTPTPTPSPTSGTPTPTPTPISSSPTPKPKPKTPQLCVRVQSFSASAEVKPGRVANFAVWVWSTTAQSNGVTVAVRVASATGVRTPAFTVCPHPSGTTCKMGNVPTGLADELQVAVRVGKQAALGEHVHLIAKATAAKSKSFSNSATDVVVAPLQSTGTSSGVPGAGELPPVSLPPVPGVGDSSSGDPSGLFPTVGPSATPGSSSLGLPPVKPHKTVRVTEAAATVPLDSRLIGGQLAGLAVLAGAVVIAIARLSLRTPKTAEDKGGEAKPPAG